MAKYTGFRQKRECWRALQESFSRSTLKGHALQTEQEHMLDLTQEPYHIYTLGIMKNNTLC